MWPHLLKKSLMENFIFCEVLGSVKTLRCLKRWGRQMFCFILNKVNVYLRVYFFIFYFLFFIFYFLSFPMRVQMTTYWLFFF